MILWVVFSLCPTIGLIVYFNLSISVHPSLAQISEEPHTLTAWLGLCSLGSLGILIGGKALKIPSAIRKKRAIGTGTAVVGFLAFTGYVYSLSVLPPAPNAPEVGEQAPDFTVVDPEGRDWTLSELKGDVLVFFYRGHW